MLLYAYGTKMHHSTVTVCVVMNTTIDCRNYSNIQKPSGEQCLVLVRY